MNFVQPKPRKLYYPNPDDPNAIVFEGPTNYDSRKSSENEVEDGLDEDTLSLLINPRFGEIGESENPKPEPPPAAPVDTGFYFPDD